MNTKNLVLMALLIGIGAALYVVTPGIVQGMKPDFMLTMMIIGILLFPSMKETFILSFTTGVISGLFSTFPAGFLPNVIDKLITGFISFAIICIARNIIKNKVASAVLIGFGTLLSGTIFLTIVLYILHANTGETFTTMFVMAVLPAIALNVVAFFIIQPIIFKLVKRSNFKTAIY